MKKAVVSTLCAVLLVGSVSARSYFDKSKDILIAQFDSRPDPDDIMAIAALGCMLAHSELDGVNYYAVAGAYGEQSDRALYIPAPDLFTMAFGAKNTMWTDAHNEYSSSVTRIKDKVKPILQNGGKVWIQEAGQSNITADWIRALISDGVAESLIKSNVILVQHSVWNEDMTAPADLTYVQDKTTYQPLDSGNVASDQDRGPQTPRYTSTDTSFLAQAKSSQNPKAKQLWVEADRVIDNHPNKTKNDTIQNDGVDYSDCVENWWIFNVADAGTVAAFWAKFVVNEVDSGGGSGAPIGKTVTFNAKANGKFVRADGNGDPVNWRLQADVTQEWSKTKFKVVDAGGGMIALIASNGKYVCADKNLDSVNRPLAANRTAIGSWEKYSWVDNSDGSVSLKSASNGKYVSADSALGSVWPLAANGSAVGTGEKFTVSVK